MSLSRAAIVDQLKEIVGADRVITDETVLKKNSIDRFRKFPDIHGIYTLPIPAAVVKLGSTEQVSRVLNFMNAHKINGVPRTGASATEGGLETVVENSVVLDGSAMNQIINIDIENMQATAQCGVPLEVLENALREKGYTTGHSPQSKPLAQMGGLVATRSIGQFSTLYGAIEDMVVGLEAVLADGTVTRIKNVPRRAAGPDIRHIIIGNEGALCYITEVTVKIFKFTPENNLFYGYILEDMKTGFNILREIMVEGYRPSIARLYDAEDGTQHFTHFADGKCVLIFMAEGNPRIAKVTGEGIAEIVARYPQCQRVDSKLIETWFNNLNWGPDKVAAERVQIDPMIDVNLTAAFELSYEAAKIMIPQKSGKIINICSLFSYLGGQWSPAYSATKHALAGFTKAYCDELGQYNIQVNGIAPGYYATDITLATRSNPETNQRVLDHIPANRWGDTQDLMGAAVFLASPASNYVNGHLLVVDGGYLVR